MAIDILAAVGPDVTLAAKPTLVGALVRLRPVRTEDAVGLAALDDETLRLTGTPRRAALEELEEWYATRAAHDDRLDLSIIERATGGWAGEVVLNDLRPDDASCGFRILLARPDLYDRGLGTEATALVLEHAFSTVGIHRIELEVIAGNDRARHVYEKVGFVYEGTKRESLRWDGSYLDVHVMSLLADEWRPDPVRHRDA